MTPDIIARYPKPRPFLLADGTRLGWAFTSRIEAALKRAEWNKGLPPLAKNYVRFRASDGSIHDVPAKHFGRALEIDPEAFLFLTKAWEKDDAQVLEMLGMVIHAIGYPAKRTAQATR